MQATVSSAPSCSTNVSRTPTADSAAVSTTAPAYPNVPTEPVRTLGIAALELEVVGERPRRLAVEVHVGVVEVSLEAVEARSELGFLVVAALGRCLGERSGRRPAGRGEPLVEHRHGGVGGGLVVRVDRRRQPAKATRASGAATASRRVMAADGIWRDSAGRRRNTRGRATRNDERHGAGAGAGQPDRRPHRLHRRALLPDRHRPRRRDLRPP